MSQRNDAREQEGAVRLKYLGRTSSENASGSRTRNAAPPAHHSTLYAFSNSAIDIANSFCGKLAVGDNQDSS